MEPQGGHILDRLAKDRGQGAVTARELGGPLAPGGEPIGAPRETPWRRGPAALAHIEEHDRGGRPLPARRDDDGPDDAAVVIPRRTVTGEDSVGEAAVERAVAVGGDEIPMRGFGVPAARGIPAREVVVRLDIKQVNEVR